MFNATNSSLLSAIQELIDVVAQLRDPDRGCPWDLEQTPESLTSYIIEEAYETVHAINSGDKHAIVEELGDLLLQVVLQAQIASERGDFSLAEIAAGISEKLIRRHPHVFGDVEVETAEEVKANWEQIKAEEKGKNSALLSDKLNSYAEKLPPLTAAMKISKKAATVGFEWDNIEGVWAKFTEELTEFQEAVATSERAHQQAELGDLLFTVINLARWFDLDPDAGLQGTNQRFIERLRQMEKYADRPLNEYTINELESLWQQAKRQIAQGNALNP
jgi:XTP/dITP diphosphohydrolase